MSHDSPGPQDRARLARLVVKAAQAGIDLGAIPTSPTAGWLDEKEAELESSPVIKPGSQAPSLAPTEPETSARESELNKFEETSTDDLGEWRAKKRNPKLISLQTIRKPITK